MRLRKGRATCCRRSFVMCPTRCELSICRPMPFQRRSVKQARTDMRGIVHAVIAEQGDMLRASGQPDGASGRVGAAARSAANALRHGGFDALANEVAEAGADALVQSTVAPLLAALDHALDAIAGVTHERRPIGLPRPTGGRQRGCGQPMAAGSRGADRRAGQSRRRTDRPEEQLRTSGAAGGSRRPAGPVARDEARTGRDRAAGGRLL